ncbi:MAG: GNAT family N-acetyltransferase [Bacilli bacterium]|nr:GNAT family N-acetyltransferase [Bacilli bacterium]
MKPRKKQIVTTRLILKNFEEKDQKDFMKIVNNPQVKKTYMLPDFASEKEESEFYEKLRLLSLNQKRFVYGIYSKNNIIGFINEVSKEDDAIEIGYFIDEKEWNKGYATEAFKAAIEELFRIGFNRIIAGFFEGNYASERVMQKCGMAKIKKEETVLYRNKERRCFYYQIEKCLS